jgi:hypothetical protein
MTRFHLRGPKSSNYGVQGGFRHCCTNDIALWSWGRFRDAAVIVDEREHTRLNAQKAWEEGDVAHMAMMRKDSAHYPDTGGWYFNIFMGSHTTSGLTASEARQRCFEACHRAQEARDFVFIEPRR